MDIPFQIQSMSPLFKYSSFVSQLMPLVTSLTPSLLQTSAATSISKPVIFPLSSLKPMGGKPSSRPITSCPESITFCKDPSFAFPFSIVSVPHPEIINTRDTESIPAIIFFIPDLINLIYILPKIVTLMLPLYFLPRYLICI